MASKHEFLDWFKYPVLIFAFFVALRLMMWCWIQFSAIFYVPGW